MNINSGKLSLLFPLLLLGACSGQPVKNPNFLILIADDQRWDQLSCADHPIIPELKTPNIDRLASGGVYYLLHDHGYTTAVLGKWGMGTEGTDKIFDLFDAWADQGRYFHATDSGKVHNEAWLAVKAVISWNPIILINHFASPFALKHLTTPINLTNGIRTF